MDNQIARASDTDLSAGEPSDHDKAMQTLERGERQQQLCFQKFSFFIAIAFVSILTGGFLYFCYRAFCLIERNNGFVDWHILLIGSGLIVPATFIAYSIVNRFSNSGVKRINEDNFELPSSKLVDALGDLISSVAKKIDS